MKVRQIPLAAVFILAGILVLCSCSPTSRDAAQVNHISVRIMATRDCGRELLFDTTFPVDAGITAMDALKKAAQVETKYGGGFVNSINGLSSEYGSANSKKKDWFFYINGILSNVGAGDYKLRQGDIEHWDFRDWSYQQFVPAIIGSYPQPFLSGFTSEAIPTVVACESMFQKEAESLQDNLKQAGVTQISAVSSEALSRESREQNNLIIIAGLQNSLISELNSLHKKLGFFAYSENGKVVVLDVAGNLSKEYGRNCGLIQATQNPWNPDGIGAGESAVWMITGTDPGGVRSAVSALINNRNDLDQAFAVIINEGAIIKIP